MARDGGSVHEVELQRAVQEREELRREYVEGIVVHALVTNWYRITRYEDVAQARPGLENIAREIRAARVPPARSR